MVSINGLPPSHPSRVQRANKAKRKDEVKPNDQQAAVTQPSKVANAVANSIRSADPADIHRAQLQYDLPEGRGRKALEEYMDVMNQARREELAHLLGVDIYI
ncbi:chromosome partitioning protein ParA [Vibrio sp.]|uniref:chromosome partitioning protein ParA n=1 Tax=Vibrio sp. TaxID=678 RepID=UPI003D0DB6E9